MDTKTTMILAKGEPISSNVRDYHFNTVSRKWEVTFTNGKKFNYNENNVVVLQNPTRLNPEEIQIQREGNLFGKISAIYSFVHEGTEYWHVRFLDGAERDYKRDELQVDKSVLAKDEAKRVFDYLKETAGFVSAQTDDGTAILSEQYAKIDFLSDNTAAAAYLRPEIYSKNSGADFKAPIFPFGCNESQFQAVTNALGNRISVIEGPPGTGKTQTILNIIANLVLQGKTVHIVSNNNSAIDNVVEKLNSPKYDMGFFIARLGRQENKNEFVTGQSGDVPHVEGWNSDEYENPDFVNSVISKSKELQELFQTKNSLAELNSERYNVQVEAEHFQTLVYENPVSISRRNLSSSEILEFLQEYQEIQDEIKKIGWLYRAFRRLTLGISIGKLLNHEPAAVVNTLQQMYYDSKLKELDAEISRLERKLAGKETDALIDEFTEMSMNCFHAALAKKYRGNKSRRVFRIEELWQKPDEFLQEYPVVLSTTYTARSSLGKNAHFDYLIMDEASQVDVATGLLALSCATNAVIVGDTKQLPNVVTSEQRKQLDEFFVNFNIPEAYDFGKYSFLSSLCALLGEKIPRTTLCEHYRCHPQIIGFCNQKFYNGELLVMTDNTPSGAIQLVTTVAGHHERDRMNLRQVEVIRDEILPKLECAKSEIGIIAPYRNQVKKLQSEIADKDIDIATVHKFQGREKDVIILSTVDDVVTEFSDDPNLLNVAVSRAKKKLIVVASDEKQPVGSNTGDLIGYIRYNNCDVTHSEISSVFDYLYDEYAEKRMAYLKKHQRISEYDSENLMYGMICDELDARENAALGVVCHQPLRLLFTDQSKMGEEERRFVNTGLSHLDFLVYNKVSKEPLLAIEVDGFHYHKEGTRQAERDKLKNHILEKYNLPLIRFTTNGSGEKEKLAEKLDEILGNDVC